MTGLFRTAAADWLRIEQFQKLKAISRLGLLGRWVFTFRPLQLQEHRSGGAFKGPSKKTDTEQNRFCAVDLAFQKKYLMIQKDDLLGQIWRHFCFQNMCYAPPQNTH